MATSVQIELMVDEKGAVSGVRAFDTAVKGSAGSVRRLNDELRSVGSTGSAGAAKAAQGIKEIGGHALTSLDNVRLLRDDFGIHIPRAMEKAIASSKMLSSAIAGIGGGLIAFGAIEIGAHVFESLIKGTQELWHNHLSLTAAAEDYYAEVEKTKQQEFGNTHSIETTRLRIDQATESAINFRREAEKAANTPNFTWRSAVPVVGPLWDTYNQRSHAQDLSAQAVEAQRQADKLKRIQDSSQYHEHIVGGIDAQHAGDSALNREQRRTAEFQKQRDLAAETRRYENEQDRILGNPVPANAGADREAIAVKRAKKEMDAEAHNDAKEQAQELFHMREQALEAGLRGSALYKAQEAAAIEELKFKDLDSTDARQAIHKKFHAEEIRRLEDEQRETAEIVEQTKLATLTGIARVQAEGQSRIDKTNADPNLPDDEKQRRTAAYQDEIAEQVAQKQIDWSQRVDEVVAQSQDRQVNGFARIRAEAEKAAAALQRQFDEAHSLMDLTKPGAQAALDTDSAKLGAGLSAITAASDRQQADLAQKNAEETERIEAEAHTKFLSAEKQKTAAIDNEYKERLQRLRDALNSGEILEDDYNRRVIAAGEEREAQMVEAATAARQKMAEQFDQLFKGLNHPMKMLQEMGEKVAGQAAAELVQRLQNRGGDTPASTGSGVGIFDSLVNGLHLGGKKIPGLGADRKAEMAHGPQSGSTFGITQATIHVGSAMFAGGGFSGGGGTTSFGAGLGGMVTGPATGGFGGGAAPSAPGFGNFSSTMPGTEGTYASGYSGAPSTGGGAVIGNAQQGVGLFQQARGIFSKSKLPGIGGDSLETQTAQVPGKFGSDGIFHSAGSTNGGMLGGGGVGANAMGAAGGALGLFAAAKGGGGVGGAMGGAMSGMQLGMALGGPAGALIGAAAGAIIGGIGSSEQARVYDLKQVRPKLTADQDAYGDGSMSYLDAYSDVQQMIGTSWAATKQMGAAGERYWGDTIKPELLQAMAKFTSEERAGRSMYTASAASYDVGTDSVPRDGFAMIHRNERIIPSDQNERITRALNVHAAYRSTMSSAAAQRGGGDKTMNMNVHAIDARGVAQFFDEHKHTMRSALNDSYAENSGGGL